MPGSLWNKKNFRKPRQYIRITCHRLVNFLLSPTMECESIVVGADADRFSNTRRMKDITLGHSEVHHLHFQSPCCQIPLQFQVPATPPMCHRWMIHPDVPSKKTSKKKGISQPAIPFPHVLRRHQLHSKTYQEHILDHIPVKLLWKICLQPDQHRWGWFDNDDVWWLMVDVVRNRITVDY